MFDINSSSLCDHLMVCKYGTQSSMSIIYMDKIRTDTNHTIHGDVTCEQFKHKDGE